MTRHGLGGGGNVSPRAKGGSEEQGSATSQLGHVSPRAKEGQGGEIAGAPWLLAGSARRWGGGKVIALARTKVPKGAPLALPVSEFLSSFPLYPLKLSVCKCDYELGASYPPPNTHSRRSGRFRAPEAFLGHSRHRVKGGSEVQWLRARSWHPDLALLCIKCGLRAL